MKSLESLIERIILAGRWILVVFYIGLGLALVLYAVSYAARFVEIAKHVFDFDESQMILAMLGLIDAALVASLVVMVMISSYENFVGRFENAESTDLSWLGKLNSGTLKIKVAASIIAISSIHLLQVFLNVDQYANDKVMWSLALHLTFVVSALLLGYLERISSKSETVSPGRQARRPMEPFASMTTAMVAEARIVRGRSTWYAYLILGFFTFALNIQGNILPFLKADLDLSYQAASLHSSAVAAGMIVVGLFGNRVIRAIGRRAALQAGSAGVVVGGVILSQAGVAWLTIASCGLIGAVGALIPATVFALLPDLHGANRDAAYTEANAVCYAFAVLAPLATGLCLAIGLGWRNAVLFGMAVGALLALFNFALPIPEPRRSGERVSGQLPRVFWIYWTAIALSCAVEFCMLLWAPSFLEQVGGLSKAAAAVCAAAFSLAMLSGRTVGSALVRLYSMRLLIVGAAVVALLGFLVYWGLGDTVLVVPGLFVIGLGVALLYPLILGLAIGAAGKLGDAASARTMLAVGTAVLTMPALLGWLADEVGLRAAHLMIPVLVLLALGCFFAGQAMERRSPRAA